MGDGRPALDVRTPARRPDLIPLLDALLDDFHPCAVEQLDAVKRRIHFFSTVDRDDASRTLRRHFGTAGVTAAPVEVPDDDWAARSQAGLTAIRIGDIVVAPPWDVPDEPGHGTLVVIRPLDGLRHGASRLDAPVPARAAGAAAGEPRRPGSRDRVRRAGDCSGQARRNLRRRGRHRPRRGGDGAGQRRAERGVPPRAGAVRRLPPGPICSPRRSSWPTSTRRWSPATARHSCGSRPAASSWRAGSPRRKRAAVRAALGDSGTLVARHAEDEWVALTLAVRGAAARRAGS